jgi:putative flippase GtrA
MQWRLKMHRLFSTRNLVNSRIIKFLSVGLLNTIFGYAVFAILIFFKVHYLAALFVATVAGVVFNYFTFGRLVFYKSGSSFTFVKFAIAYTAVYITNAALLGALTRDFLFSYYFGQMICIPPSVFLSWLLLNYWVYKED